MSDPSDEAGVELGLEALAGRLERARFTTAFRGFEPTEVQDLLRSTAHALRLAAAGRAPEDAGAPETEPTEREGGAVAMRLRRAEQDAAALLQSARAEAERIVAEGHREADALRAEAGVLHEQARAAILKGVREANELVLRARKETGQAGPGART